MPGQFDHPSIDDAIRSVARAAANTGKNWAATCGSLEQARRMVEMGARLIFHGADIIHVKNGLENIRSTFARELGITFENRLPGNAAATPASRVESP